MRRRVVIDEELYEIILAMQKSPVANKAIRRYAWAVIKPQAWDEKYRDSYSPGDGDKTEGELKPRKKRKKRADKDWEKSYKKEY